MLSSVSCPVTEPSQVGEARRLAQGLARSLGFDEVASGRVGIIVTEAAGNLCRHAGGGEIVLSPMRGFCNPQTPWSATRIESMPWHIDILALDKGPGMHDVDECLRDGFSTGATPGTGLGAIRRQADVFAVHSQPGVGTALLARMFAKRELAETHARTLQSHFSIGAVCVAMEGETACGDAFETFVMGSDAHILMVDGLGHGPQAAVAASGAVTYFLDDPFLLPKDALTKSHLALRSTRGAAVAHASLDLAKRELRFAGMGNISASFQTDTSSRGFVSLNGIVGVGVPKAQEFREPLPDGAGGYLVLHSDGLATQWKLESYRGLRGSDPALVAGVLYRDFRRSRDDASVVVVRLNS